MTSPRGVTIRRSHHTVKETIDLLQSYLQKHGATIYVRIDQRAEAEKVGLSLSALEFILFGNPKGGVPAMQQNSLVALDLPLKIISWEDCESSVWVAYNEAKYIEQRYMLTLGPDSVLDIDAAIQGALNA
jgi:uncharacterized protein (DUF302 family)